MHARTQNVGISNPHKCGFPLKLMKYFNPRVCAFVVIIIIISEIFLAQLHTCSCQELSSDDKHPRGITIKILNSVKWTQLAAA